MEANEIINTVIPYILIAISIFIFREPIFGFLKWVGGFFVGIGGWFSEKKQKITKGGIDYE